MKYYLSFISREDAIERSAFQAFKRKCQPPTPHSWPDAAEVNGLWYMDVSYGKDDGGVWLTQEEVARVVEELPTQNP